MRCRPLLGIAEHFFTAGTIELRDTEAEWASVAAFAGVAAEHLRPIHQVHGRDVVLARRGGERLWTRPTADAIASDDPTVALVVRVADCAPILIGDRASGVVAAVHAGWRGTMLRVATGTVESLVRTFGSRPQDLVAAVGPSLGTCCGEMGGEVVEAFRANGHSETDLGRWFARRPGRKAHFDLWQANRDQLARAGVRDDNIHIAGLCTKTHATVFHSYRVKGTSAGRMAAVIRPA